MSRRTSSLPRDGSRGQSSPHRQPSHPRSPRPGWEDSLRVRGGNAGRHSGGPSSPESRASPRGGAATPASAGSSRRPQTPASMSSAARPMTPHGSGAVGSGSRLTPSRMATSRATAPTKASAARAVDRVDRGSTDRFGSDRHSSSTGWSSPRRAGPPAVAVGRSAPPTSYGGPGHGVGSIGPATEGRSHRDDVPEMWDLPFDSERVAQLASASPVSRRRLTSLLQEVQSEIGRIFGNERMNLAPTPEGACISSTPDGKLVGSNMAHDRGTLASGSTSVPSTATVSTAGSANTRMAEGSAMMGTGGTGSPTMEAESPEVTIVRRLCDRVCHLQSTLDAVWEAGIEPLAGHPDGGGVSSDMPPNSRYGGAPESVAGLARLEDMLGRLENQVSMSFPVLKNAMSMTDGRGGRVGGRRSELSMAVGELEQQKLALEAEVRSLMQQKQEITAGANVSGPPIGMTPRRNASGPERPNVISPERLRKASSPGPPTLPTHGATGSAGTGDFDADSEVTCDLASGIAASPPTASPSQVIAGTSAIPLRVSSVEEATAGSRSGYMLAGNSSALAATSGVAANAAAAMAATTMPIMGTLQPNRGGSVAVPPVVGLSALRGMPNSGAQARVNAGAHAGSHGVTVPRTVQASVLAGPAGNTPPSSPRPYAAAMQPMMSSYASLARSPQRPRQATPGSRPCG